MKKRKTDPKVTIVTPSYNQAEYLEQAILSIQEQNYSNVEHIVIDGASTDKTLEVLQKYNDQIRWVSEQDSGQAEALNKGFNMASGEIIGWMNADDLYLPNAISRAVAALVKSPDVAMVHGDGDYVDEKGHVTHRIGRNVGIEDILCVNTIMSISAFWRRDVFDKIGYLNEELHYVLDWEFWVRIGLAEMRIMHIPAPALSISREHLDAKTMTVKDKFYAERFKILEGIFADSNTAEHIRALENRAKGGVYASGVYFYLRNGNFPKAISSLRKALATYPKIFLEFRSFYSWQNITNLIRSYYLRLNTSTKQSS